MGRFITEDPHWNPNNMIYGDKEYKIGEVKTPDMNAIMQSSGLYVYCMNNPLKYADSSGESVSGLAIAGLISLCALDGFITGAIYAADGKDFKFGFAAGFGTTLATTVSGILGGAVGTVISSSISSSVVTIVEDIIYSNKSIEEIAKSAAGSAAKGIITGVSSAYWDETIGFANKAGSVAESLMEYDKNFGEAIKIFFNEIVNVLSMEADD